MTEAKYHRLMVLLIAVALLAAAIALILAARNANGLPRCPHITRTERGDLVPAEQRPCRLDDQPPTRHPEPTAHQPPASLLQASATAVRARR